MFNSDEYAGYLGRDDRPGAVNNLTFYFQLNERPQIPPSMKVITLALRGPLGYSFGEDCLPDIRVLPLDGHPGAPREPFPPSNGGRPLTDALPLPGGVSLLAGRGAVPVPGREGRGDRVSGSSWIFRVPE